MDHIVETVEAPASNTVTLEALLEGGELRFRSAVIGALLQEGFDLDETFPYLHHPLEIMESIGWLKSCGFGSAWEAFHDALHKAGTLGILVDLRLDGSSSVFTPLAGWLETA
jgi:hypothetical protein